VVVVAVVVVAVVDVFDTHLLHVRLKLKKIRSNDPIPAIDAPIKTQCGYNVTVTHTRV
jgi:hypothetical protein